jgi:hypothetical protein
MANARSHFDMISSYLQRTHEAQAGLLYGKPCLMLQGQAFAAYQSDAMAFRMHGRALAQTVAMPGVLGWDPLHADRSGAPGWVLVPGTHALRWNRLALEALRCAREASERRVNYGEVPAPPPTETAPASNPASLAQRVSTAIASGFRSLSLSPLEREP